MLLTRNDHTPSPESPVRHARTALDSNQGVPANLTYNLTRKQQTVKFMSVSAGFPNHSYTVYQQDSADIENDNRSGIKTCSKSNLQGISKELPITVCN